MGGGGERWNQTYEQTIKTTYLDTLNDANDISADPLTKSPMIPFHWSATGLTARHRESEK